VFVKLLDMPCQQKRSPIVPDHGCFEYYLSGSSNTEMQPDFVKFGTNAIKKVAKYGGELGRNGYIFAIGILTQEKQK